MMSQNCYGRAGGGAAGSVVFGGSFAGSGVAEVLGGGVVGAEFILSGGADGDAPALGGAGRSQAVRPSEMSNAAAKAAVKEIFFMMLLTLETKVLRATQNLPQHVPDTRRANHLPRNQVKHKVETTCLCLPSRARVP